MQNFPAPAKTYANAWLVVSTGKVFRFSAGIEIFLTARYPGADAVYADAAYVVLTKPAREYTGNSLLCEDVLLESGVTDLSVYDYVPGSDLGVDLWVDTPNPPDYKGP